MKLYQLVNSRQALGNFATSKIPLTTAFELKVFIEKVNPELQSFETIKNDKIKEYGEEIIENEKSTGNWKVKQENFKQYVEELNEILNKELDIKIPEIKKDELSKFKDKDGNPFLISIEDLVLLDWLIVE